MKQPKRKNVAVTITTHKRIKNMAKRFGMKVEAVADKSANEGMDRMEKDARWP